MGCNPPETCFTCRHPDCKNNCLANKAESKFTELGMQENEQDRKAEKRELYQMRKKLHLCTRCGKELTAEDGGYAICRSCRARNSLRYKKRAAQKTRGKKQY